MSHIGQGFSILGHVLSVLAAEYDHVVLASSCFISRLMQSREMVKIGFQNNIIFIFISNKSNKITIKNQENKLKNLNDVIGNLVRECSGKQKRKNTAKSHVIHGAPRSRKILGTDGCI